MGEWNDCLYNDIMHLKRNVIESLEDQGSKKKPVWGDRQRNILRKNSNLNLTHIRMFLYLGTRRAFSII